MFLRQGARQSIGFQFDVKDSMLGAVLKYKDLQVPLVLESTCLCTSEKGYTTLPDTNMAPENNSLQKEIPIGNHPFLGTMLVLGRVGVGSKDFSFSPVPEKLI